MERKKKLRKEKINPPSTPSPRGWGVGGWGASKFFAKGEGRSTELVATRSKGIFCLFFVSCVFILLKKKTQDSSSVPSAYPIGSAVG